MGCVIESSPLRRRDRNGICSAQTPWVITHGKGCVGPPGVKREWLEICLLCSFQRSALSQAASDLVLAKLATEFATDVSSLRVILKRIGKLVAISDLVRGIPLLGSL